MGLLDEMEKRKKAAAQPAAGPLTSRLDKKAPDASSKPAAASNDDLKLDDDLTLDDDLNLDDDMSLDDGPVSMSAKTGPAPLSQGAGAPAAGPALDPSKYSTDRILELLDKVDDLPTLPGVAVEAMKLLRSSYFSARELATLLERDPPLTAKLIKLSNSAYYAGNSEISTVQNAVVRLGNKTVSDIVMGVSVFKCFHGFSHDDFNLHEYWKHSVAVAMGANHIAHQLKIQRQGEVFTAGMLHDIGKIIMLKFLSEPFGLVISNVKKNPALSFIDAERQSLSFTHADIGGWFAVRWKLGAILRQVIANHHTEPARLSMFEKSLVEASMVVRLADSVCHVKGIGTTIPGDKANGIDPVSADYLAGGVKGAERFLPEFDAIRDEATKYVELVSGK